jgi:hypothetical protein
MPGEEGLGALERLAQRAQAVAAPELPDGPIFPVTLATATGERAVKPALQVVLAGAPAVLDCRSRHLTSTTAALAALEAVASIPRGRHLGADRSTRAGYWSVRSQGAPAAAVMARLASSCGGLRSHSLAAPVAGRAMAALAEMGALVRLGAAAAVVAPESLAV